MILFTCIYIFRLCSIFFKNFYFYLEGGLLFIGIDISKPCYYRDAIIFGEHDSQKLQRSIELYRVFSFYIVAVLLEIQASIHNDFNLFSVWLFDCLQVECRWVMLLDFAFTFTLVIFMLCECRLTYAFVTSLFKFIFFFALEEARSKKWGRSIIRPSPKNI